MIVEALLGILFSFVKMIIGLLPKMNLTVYEFNTVKNVMWLVGYIMPQHFTWALVGSLVFWNTTQYTWALVEWLYKKIPGVE